MSPIFLLDDWPFYYILSIVTNGHVSHELLFPFNLIWIYDLIDFHGNFIGSQETINVQMIFIFINTI